MKRRSGLINRAGGVAGLVNEYTGLNMIFPGHIDYTARTTAPAGWMACDGRALSRAVYASLFAAIGTTYGAGDGSTTFNIPDLRGEFIRGLDSGRGVDSGRAMGSGQTDAMQGHWHEQYYQTGVATQGGSGVLSGSGTLNATLNSSSNAIRQPKSDGSSGTPRTAAETRPRNVALLPIIRY